MGQIKDFIEKVSPSDSDLLAIQEATGITKKITRENFLSGIGGDGGSGWSEVATNGSLSLNSKLLISATAPITVTLPTGLIGEIEIFNFSSSKISVNLNGGKYSGTAYSTGTLALTGVNTYTRLLWINNSIGWYPLNGTLEAIGNYPTGMRVWLEGGSFNDRSGNSNNLSPVNSATPPLAATGIDNRRVLRWNGTGTQEIQASPFLSDCSSATLYCVFTVTANNHYNLCRTRNVGDYWRFTNNGAGYIGTFRSSRFEAYPLDMPSSGSHLISIHASSSTYEVLLDNTTKGSQSSSFDPGNIFRIGANDMPFNGDLALQLIYPSFISKSSSDHTAIVTAIKSFYPSLPFTI